MSGITPVWLVAAGVCLALALLHFLVWLRSRDSLANLLFVVAAMAAGATAVQEAFLMHAKTPAEYGELMRWMHVSIAAIVIAMVWFIRLHLRAGRLWLAWLVTGLRVLVLLVNFLTLPNATFREITGLRFVPWMGEVLPIPVGEPNPWRFLIHLSTVALLIYVLDAGVTAWRTGDRRRASTLCGAISAVIVLSVVFSQLVVSQVLPVPLLGLTFLLIVLAIALELSLDLIRARQTARELRDSRERMRLATSGADVGIWEWHVGRDEVWVSDTIRDGSGLGASERIDLERSLELVHRDDRERVRRTVRDALESSREFKTEYRQIAPSGKTRWIAARGQVVRADNGQPILIRGVTHDITQRKADEAKLLEQRSELARVQRAYMIGQLGSTLAHELNQPLGAILRNAEA
ncbi:MAG TPA: PAS domain-containing protein, partial [Steroidobacteraceae bacterium]|nr:PAS domain-containing protein [Steroidobacteraceae bacterium]